MLAVGMRPARKRGAVETRRVVEVEIEGHAVQVLGGAQAVGHRCGLLLPVVGLSLGMGAGMKSGAVETEGYGADKVGKAYLLQIYVNS